MIATSKALKSMVFKFKDRPKVELEKISNRKFKQLKKKQQHQMMYEDYSYLNLFGGKF